MFGSHEGPFLLEQHLSYIKYSTIVSIFSSVYDDKLRLAFAVFGVKGKYIENDLKYLCTPGEVSSDKWNVAAESQLFSPYYLGQKNIVDPNKDLNGTYHVWSVEIVGEYKVKQAAWYNVLYQICSENNEAAVGVMDGTLSFHNPYGYIPAEQYGLLPFHGARMVAMLGLFGYYSIIYCYYLDSVLSLHTAILLVLMVALVEAILWFTVYERANLSGEPNCCPFPVVMILAIVMQIVRQTCGRLLLLVISLGYGIVRPNLLSSEWIAIMLICLLYLGSTSIAGFQIVESHPLQQSLGWTDNISRFVPEIIVDIMFLTWINLAINSTIRILADFQQYQKLEMYRRLSTTILLLVTIFTFLSIFIMLGMAGWLSWSWQLSWLQLVGWETLNFSILATVCCICRPYENSRMLAYAAQIPTDDPDEISDFDFDFNIVHSKIDDYSDKGGVEMVNQNELSRRNHGSSNFSSLPSAYSDDEFGLDDESG